MSEGLFSFLRTSLRECLTRFFDFAFDLGNFIVIMFFLIMIALIFHNDWAPLISQ